jgi:predicted dehydrogenase
VVPETHIGFLGAGGIAQAHVYALDTLKFYYPNTPAIVKVAVASPTPSSREGFSHRFGFQDAIAPDELWNRYDIDTLFILGANHTHTPQLLRAAQMPSVERIYLEKPAGTSREDIDLLEALDQSHHGKFIMMGFQFLQKSALRAALAHWHSDVFGEPIHFRVEYLHSSYLDPVYREKNIGRLQPIPLNGAAVDLGSHALSLLIAFLGSNLVLRSAASSGRFPDVTSRTDFCTTAMFEEPASGAIGTLVASRVAQGTGDLLKLEIRATGGALLYDSTQPDVYQTYLPQSGWQIHEVMSNYLPASKFPSDYMPSGWLRALVHNHYLFFGGDPEMSFIPDLHHGIQVQRLIQGIADHILTS